MKRAICFLLFFFLCASATANANPEEMFRDKLIGGTIKGMANAYIDSYDIENAKKFALVKVEAMSPARFAKLYAYVWPFVKDLPPDVKDKYRLVPMSQKKMVELIKTIQASDLQIMISQVPDSAIRDQFDWGIQQVSSKIDPNDFLSQLSIMRQAAQRVFDKIQQFQDESEKQDKAEDKKDVNIQF